MRVHYENLNIFKIREELEKSGVPIVSFESDGTSDAPLANNIWITFKESTDMALVKSIIASHDPTPLPKPLSETEQLRLDMARSNAEMFEAVIALVGGI